MQYIVFTLGKTYYGIATDEVEEIAKTFSSTPVPQSPTWAAGLINLRGQIMTLVNFDNLLNPTQDTHEVCYNNTIIAHVGEGKIALMVDTVIGVFSVEKEDIQSIEAGNQEAVTALFPANGQIVSAIDLNGLFVENEG